MAQLRADGLAATSPAAPPRRAPSSATCSCSASAGQPRGRARAPAPHAQLPRTLSPGEAERLIGAANGIDAAALRDRASSSSSTEPGLRVSEAVGLEKGGVDLDDRLVRVIGKGGKERIVPSAARRAMRSAATCRAGGPTSTGGTAPSCS